MSYKLCINKELYLIMVWFDMAGLIIVFSGTL